MKYQITDEAKTLSDGTIVRRIVAVAGDVAFFIKPGRLGGWVESESNLSQDGTCWIDNDAMAIGCSVIEGRAQVRGRAVIRESANLKEDAFVLDDAVVGGNAIIGGMCRIEGQATVDGASSLDGTVIVTEQGSLTDCELHREGVVNRSSAHGPTFIDGLYYRVTIMDEHIRLGSMLCGWTPTFDEFANASERELLQVDHRPAVLFYREHRDWLLERIAAHVASR